MHEASKDVNNSAVKSKRRTVVADHLKISTEHNLQSDSKTKNGGASTISNSIDNSLLLVTAANGPKNEGQKMTASGRLLPEPTSASTAIITMR